MTTYKDLIVWQKAIEFILETQIFISKKLPKTSELDYNEVDSLLGEIMRMLNKLISELAPKA